jgi:hypothetical protein
MNRDKPKKPKDNERKRSTDDDELPKRIRPRREEIRQQPGTLSDELIREDRER